MAWLFLHRKAKIFKPRITSTLLNEVPQEAYDSESFYNHKLFEQLCSLCKFSRPYWLDNNLSGASGAWKI